MSTPAALIKKILGETATHSIRHFLNQLQEKWLILASQSKLTARLHYTLFSSAFDREMQGVLSGHVLHLENRRSTEPVNYFLRRSIHRLEKGLIMRPYRPVFALSYINETVKAYRAGRIAGLNTAEIKWAHNVLSRYFQVTEAHPVIEQARCAFIAIENAAEKKIVDCGYIPYQRNLSQPLPVTTEALAELAWRRRSVRWYEQRPVTRSLIDQAIQIGALSPSACNRQPFEFRIFDDSDLVKKLVRLPGGASGFDSNIPIIAVLVGHLRAYPLPQDRHLIYIDGGLAAMSFIYGLETAGLSSCAINWPDIAEQETAMANMLKLSKDERIIMLIAIGYPDPSGLVPNSKKIELDQLRRYN